MGPIRVWFKMTSLWESKIMRVLSIICYNKLLTHKHQQVVQVYYGVMSAGRRFTH